MSESKNNKKKIADPKKQDKEFKKWLEAQIALQTEALNSLKESEAREIKEGQIALKEQELKRKLKK
jgi:hypothetical protein